MRTRCSDCGNFIECEVAYTSDDRITLRGVEFTASQQHAFCPVCGAEIYPNPVVDYNVQHAHDAYRQAIGSVTAGEIQGILDIYSISAGDLSKLLGWEENTIERQLKHVIPNREQAELLLSLSDPQAMRLLLGVGRGRISEDAWQRSIVAVGSYQYQPEIISEDGNRPTYTITKNGHNKLPYYPVTGVCQSDLFLNRVTMENPTSSPFPWLISSSEETTALNNEPLTAVAA